MNRHINNIRVASYSMIFWCSVTLLFLGFMPGVDPDDPEAVSVDPAEFLYK